MRGFGPHGGFGGFRGPHGGFGGPLMMGRPRFGPRIMPFPLFYDPLFDGPYCGPYGRYRCRRSYGPTCCSIF